jgi:steroid 5-alpha reductase family enzyme
VTPLTTAFLICGLFAALSWLLSVMFREYSWVDRLWSISPVVFTAWFAWSAETMTPRLMLMTGLAVLWGARLTYNFARKGGYAKGGEDYRWTALRERFGDRAFAVFNFFFIAVFQNILLMLLAVPTWMAAQSSAPLGWLDAVATGLFVIFWVGEAVADEQQWRFQTDKYARIERGDAVQERFLTRGLFRYSRHPNFFCEQAMWWTMYLFTVAAGAGGLNVSILGVALLTLLFQGSTTFTERLSVAKYPEYADYQRTTSRLFPWFSSQRATPAIAPPS